MTGTRYNHRKWCLSETNTTSPEKPMQAIKELNPETQIFLYVMSPKELNISGWNRNPPGSPYPLGGYYYFQILTPQYGIHTTSSWFSVGIDVSSNPPVIVNDYIIDRYYPQHTAMDLGNPDWQNYWREELWLRTFYSTSTRFPTTSLHDYDPADGYIIDGAETSPYSSFPFCPFSYATYTSSGFVCNYRPSGSDVHTVYPHAYHVTTTPTTTTWLTEKYKRDLFDFLKNTAVFFREKGKRLMVNPWSLSNDYIDLMNQFEFDALEECGFLCDEGNYRSYNHWLTKLQNLQRATNSAILSVNRYFSPHPEEGVLALDYEGGAKVGTTTLENYTGWDALWFTMSSFLLGYEPQARNGKGNGYFYFSAWRYQDDYWLDEYDPQYLHLGLPRGPARRVNESIPTNTPQAWMREFERGFIWVNPTSNTTTINTPNNQRVKLLNHGNSKNPTSIIPTTTFELGPWKGVMGLKVDQQMISF
jgi:hypothetical protein